MKVSSLVAPAALGSVLLFIVTAPWRTEAWCHLNSTAWWSLPPSQRPRSRLSLLSSDYLENDLVAIVVPSSSLDDDDDNESSKDENKHKQGRLCAVTPEGGVVPLCHRLDDVETDLLADPREFANPWYRHEVSDEHVCGTYEEGFYGQRPVPSLGGGPGYGAQADEVWSVDQAVMEAVAADGVWLPEVDMGIAHGEKARAGTF